MSVKLSPRKGCCRQSSDAVQHHQTVMTHFSCLFKPKGGEGILLLLQVGPLYLCFARWSEDSLLFSLNESMEEFHASLQGSKDCP